MHPGSSVNQQQLPVDQRGRDGRHGSLMNDPPGSTAKNNFEMSPAPSQNSEDNSTRRIQAKQEVGTRSPSAISMAGNNIDTNQSRENTTTSRFADFQFDFNEPPSAANGFNGKHQEPQLPPRPIRHHRHILSYWRWELLTIAVAIFLLGAIIALLAYYDGRYQPEWPFGINLSTAINFLATVLRAAMLALLAEIIGQIKWTWFTERTRPLHHLQDFESASRSVLGSIKLLGVVIWTRGLTSSALLVVAASVATIASLAVGPFAQQAVKTGSCPSLLSTDNASIPVAYRVPGSTSYYRLGAGRWDIEVDMKAAMIQALTFPSGKDSAVSYHCPSGNCTFPDQGTGVTHASIGLCSKCLDTTDFVSGPDDGGNLTLPDSGSYINFGGNQPWMWVGYSNLTWATEKFSPEFAEAAASAISNFTVLAVSTSPCSGNLTEGTLVCPHNATRQGTSYGGEADYIAASCTLYPCMKEYSGLVNGSKLIEKVVAEKPTKLNTIETTGGYIFTGAENYTAIREPCLLDNGTWYTEKNMSRAQQVPGRTWANITLSDGSNATVPNACLYKMGGQFASAMSYFMSYTLFTGECRYDNMQSGRINCGESWWLSPLWIQKNATFGTVETAINDFATAVTNKLRSTGSGPDAFLKDAHALGVVYESSMCIYFDKQWIAFPVLLTFICCAILVWILLKNYHEPEQPVWKGSVLPLMFFGLQQPGNQGMRAEMTMDVTQGRRPHPELNNLENEASRMWVRFSGGSDPCFTDLGTAQKGSKGDPKHRQGNLEEQNQGNQPSIRLDRGNIR
ncbi:uncharacterized protein CTRU02_214962 [Colletotrichum truncatum]|uniref:Uncharacterized protein n=1 Tax=Colletotrichum truncatum TaxID=5467 RepID=A0ACC3YE71_COLTU|nr:uncharacterized protein CTRU02_08286 [Colletotrichum truncatum]KAF6790157.1 hypothetical protein CTRU02_08286 [Colletotrichum truncatum]